MPNSDIAFLTAVIPSYKVWIYHALDKHYAGRFIAVHSNEPAGTLPVDVRDTGLARDVRVRSTYVTIGGIELVWLHAVRWFIRARPGTLILQDGVRILSNLAIHALARVLGTKVLYYGHASNRQAGSTRSRLAARVTEWIRHRYLEASDGVIVYSESIRDDLRTRGLRAPVFVAPNMIDTDEARRDLAQITQSNAAEFRREYGIGPGDRVLVTVSRLVPSKRLDDFVGAIKSMEGHKGPRVVGIVIGDGPERRRLEAAVGAASIVFLGHLERTDLRTALLAADFMYLPGPVGLAVVEAFCAGLPVICHEDEGHGPEVDYLRDTENCLIVRSPDRVAGAVKCIELLMANEALHRQLAMNALATAQLQLQTAGMIEGFTAAIDSRRTS